MSSPTKPVPPAPLSDDTVKVWKRTTETERRKWHNEDVKCLLATIADRDKRLADVKDIADGLAGFVALDGRGIRALVKKLYAAAEGRTP
jgi:hypothetical protein